MCLSFNATDRPSFEECLSHPWVVGDPKSAVGDVMALERSKPVSVSVPKNLAMGGVNPHQLRQALLDDATNSQGECVLVGSPMETDDILLESSASSSMAQSPVLSASPDDTRLAVPENATATPQVIVGNATRVAPIRHPMAQQFDQRQLSPRNIVLHHLQQQHSPALSSGLGSACSSAYSSACSSYISGSSMCGSL